MKMDSCQISLLSQGGEFEKLLGQGELSPMSNS